MRSDDLAPLLVPPPSAAVRYGQAKILTWDPHTFRNTLDWRGVTLRDVPVLAGVSALGYAPGDVVGLLGWAPTAGGIGSWWIIGKVALPGHDSPDLIVRGSSIRLSGDRVLLAFNTNTLAGEQDGVLQPYVSGEGRAAVRLTPPFTVGSGAANPALILEGRTTDNTEGGVFLASPSGNAQIEAGDTAFVISNGQVQIISDIDEVFLSHGVFSGSANAAFSGDFIFEVSSARRFKTDIRDFQVSPRTVLDLKPRTWRDKTEVAKDPQTGRWHVGFIAEEVADAGLDAFVDHDTDGRPHAVTYDRLTIALLELCRHQQRQLDHLTAWASRHGYTPPAEPAGEPTRLPKRTPPHINRNSPER